MECIAYKAGYKYQLKENYVAEISIKPEVSIDTEYLTLTIDGVLTVKKRLCLGRPIGADNREFGRDKILRDNRFMTQVSIEEMQRDLVACLKRVEAGETLLIVRAGKPVAEVKPVGSLVENLRPFGLCKGEFTVPDDFDAPLPEDILKLNTLRQS